jgi:hypothetical protein
MMHVPWMAGRRLLTWVQARYEADRQYAQWPDLGSKIGLGNSWTDETRIDIFLTEIPSESSLP